MEYRTSTCVRLLAIRTFVSASALLVCLVSAQSNAEPLRILVWDEVDQPIEKAEAKWLELPTAGISWTAGSNGQIELTPFVTSSDTNYLIVRAEGYSSSIMRFRREEVAAAANNRQTTVHLQRGSQVHLHFRLPDGVLWQKDVFPDVYFQSYQEEARILRQPMNRENYRKHSRPVALDMNMLNARLVEGTTFELQLTDASPPFMVAIHAPGFLQSFEAGPFTLADFKDGNLDIEIPKPATLDVKFDTSAISTDERPFRLAAVYVMQRIPGKTSYLELLREPDILTAKSVSLHDLPPGHYIADIRTQPKDETKTPGDEPHPGMFFDRQEFDLAAGEEKAVEFRFEPLNLTAFRGTRTAEVQIQTASGQPAAGRKVRVTMGVRHYRPLRVFNGDLPETAELKLSDLSDAKEAGESYGPYYVEVDDHPVGTFQFAGVEPSQKFSFRCRPEAGDQAPDIEFLDVASAKRIKLSDLRGKVVLIDFWATWCGPCQPAMAHLNQIAGEQADRWKDKIEFVAISCDDTAEHAQEHTLNRGWTHLKTYWTGGEDSIDFQAPAMRAFMVNGIPESMLIDRDGKIIWRGHPLGNEGQALEARIETAIRQ